MLRSIKQFLADKAGVTMIEYALIAALVAIAAITILTTMGTSISKIFSKVNSSLTAA
jgi:pilus assembly protein Flp/PilA